MQLNAYLNFNGNCKEAFEFYEKCLGGKIIAMVTHADMPEGANAGPEWRDRIMHARLRSGDAVLMGSDAPPEYFEEPKGFAVSVQVDDPAMAERVFEALAEGGVVRMPIQETSWAVRFAMLVDRFGIPWMINCERAA